MPALGIGTQLQSVLQPRSEPPSTAGRLQVSLGGEEIILEDEDGGGRMLLRDLVAGGGGAGPVEVDAIASDDSSLAITAVEPGKKDGQVSSEPDPR